MRRFVAIAGLLVWGLVLTPTVSVLQGQVIISEFLAANQSGLRDQDGDFSDWIELHNPTANTVSLNGWFLTDDEADLTQWRLPATNIPPGGYMVVFASGKDRAAAGKELHTKFKLSAGGEYLGLVKPDGQTRATEFRPAFPEQYEDVSYGFSMDGAETPFLPVGTEAHVLVPDADIGTAWRTRGFDDSTWTVGASGVGYDTTGAYLPWVGLNVEVAMRAVRATIYARLPFVVTNLAAFNDLTLMLRYDDGFIAYLNGTEVRRVNAATNSVWFSAATTSHSAAAPEYFGLSSFLPLLVAGTNVLALHGMNRAYTDFDFLLMPELVGRQLQVNTNSRLFFSTPSPGGGNALGFAAVAPPPSFSVPGGIHPTSSVTVSLSAGTPTPPGAVIRYTLDGTDPTPASPVYATPLTLTANTLVKARVFAAELVPSPVASQTYLLLGPDVLTFNSNLPLIVINTFGRSITESAETVTSARVIPTWGGRSSLTGPADYDGRSALQIRGSSSTMFPKKSYSFELQDDSGDDQDASLLGMPEESDWVLYAPYTDKTLMRDVLAYRLSEAMGHYSPRTRFVELFVHSGAGGRLTMGDYQGVYVLEEKIKRGSDRVDVARLLPGDAAEPAITGGYIIKKDRLDPGDAGMTTSYGIQLAYVEPKEQEATAAQKNWLRNYLNQFEAALYGASFRDPVNGYAKFIDPDSFVDQQWIVEMSKNIDGYRLSNYMHKDRLGRLTMDPIWDWNLSFGNADYLEGWQTNGWYWPQVGDSDYPWFRRLFQDVDFNQRYIDRWGSLKTGVFGVSNLLARVDDYAALLSEAQVRNYQRWPILGQYVWPNWYIGNTYAQEVAWMKQWIVGRLGWIDRNFLRTPSATRAAGPVTAGTTVGLTAPLGTIYYTLTGEDPRAVGGAVSSRASTYQAVIRVDANVRLFARARYTNTWSPPLVASYYTQVPALIVNEIHYHPSPPPLGSIWLDEDFEFIELKNIGTTPLNLSGVRLSGGLTFSFPISGATNLPPGGLAVLVRNVAAFVSRYGTGIPMAGVYSGALANGGDRIVLTGALGEPILDFEFNDIWHPTTDGYGFSLVMAGPPDPARRSGLGGSWRASSVPGGSPGSEDTSPGIPPIWVNEALTHTDPPQLDTVELFNPHDFTVDVSNWYLTDDRKAVAKFRIPAGTAIGPGDHLVFDETDFRAIPGDPTSFNLDSHGEEVFLFSADATGQLTGYSQGFDFGAAINGVSFGRHVTSVGEFQYPPQSTNSLSGRNLGPLVGPVVINEIRHRPAVGQEEFVELRNTSDQPVRLYDPDHPTNTWRVDGIGFRFPTGVQVPAGGMVLLCAVEPNRFRTLNGVPAGVPVFSYHPASLDDDGERLALERPDHPDVDTNGVEFIPYTVVDAVRFRSQWPWSDAGGSGASLERLNPFTFGNEPLNWQVSTNRGSPAVENPGSFPVWRLGYFTSTELQLPAVSGVNADPDGDGFNNGEEYVARTDPRDPASILQFDSIDVVTAPTPGVRLAFRATAGRSYTVQYRDAAGFGEWSNLADVAAQPSGRTVEVVDPGGANGRYFRLVCPRLP